MRVWIEDSPACGSGGQLIPFKTPKIIKSGKTKTYYLKKAIQAPNTTNAYLAYAGVDDCGGAFTPLPTLLVVTATAEPDIAAVGDLWRGEG